MFKPSFWTLLFFVLLFSSVIAFGSSVMLSSVLLILAAVVLALELVLFLYRSKRKRVGKIKIEEVSFSRNFVFRSFFSPKDLWIIYDKNDKKFRPAGFREMPLQVGLTIIIGLVFLYTAYLIFSNLFHFPEIFLPRALIFLILLLIGFYDFFIGVARVISITNKKNEYLANKLNKNRSLKNFIRKQDASFEITPNLTLRGAVSSVEIVTKKKYDTKKIEKLLLKVSRSIR